MINGDAVLLLERRLRDACSALWRHLRLERLTIPLYDTFCQDFRASCSPDSCNLYQDRSVSGRPLSVVRPPPTSNPAKCSRALIKACVALAAQALGLQGAVELKDKRGGRDGGAGSVGCFQYQPQVLLLQIDGEARPPVTL